MRTDDPSKPVADRSIEPGDVVHESVRFVTTDGVALDGDLATSTGAIGAAIVCHPHPTYGGDRFNPVVDALHSALPAAGFASVRFDFRPDFDDGRGERLDAEAAIGLVRTRIQGVPIVAIGYSFGAIVAASLPADELAAKVLIAPPLAPSAVTPGCRTLVLTPAHDQFAPPEVAEPVTNGWDDTTFEVVSSTDHFLVGRAAVVATRTVTWLSS